MKFIPNTSKTLKTIKESASKHFPESQFNFYWNEDDLILSFRNDVNPFAASISTSLIKQYTKLSVKFQLFNTPKEKCHHDYLRILTNDYGLGKHEGDYECTFCGDIKTQKELEESGKNWSD
jgi:hypothetical protein